MAALKTIDAMKNQQLKGYVPSPKWWVTKAIGSEATLILLELINTERMFADDEGWFNCSVNMITKHTGLVKHTILNRVDRLEKIFKFIEKGYRKYRNCNVTCYRIRYDMINAFTEEDCDVVTEGGSACDAPVHAMHPYKNSKDDDPGIQELEIRLHTTYEPEYLPNDGSRAPEKNFCIQNDDSVNSESSSTDAKKKNTKRKKKTESQRRGSDKNDTSMIDINNQPEWLNNESPNIGEDVVASFNPSDTNGCISQMKDAILNYERRMKQAQDLTNINLTYEHARNEFMEFKKSPCWNLATQPQREMLEKLFAGMTRSHNGKVGTYSGTVQMHKDELSQQMRQDGYEPHEVKAFMSQQSKVQQPRKVAGAEEEDSITKSKSVAKEQLLALARKMGPDFKWTPDIEHLKARL